MAVDPVPWFIGGGAQHSPEVARLLAYAAFRGNEGIIEPDALKVQALAVPGPQVQVMPGACSILNRAAGGQYQAYAGRITAAEPLGVAATGSAGGRSDLVVMRVEDPYMPGEPWQDPADPTVGPYIFPRIIAGVPAGTKTVTGLGLGYSAIPLARIDLPANTGTVQPAHIVDLRRVANPRRERAMDVLFPPGDNNIPTGVNYYATRWPSVATKQVDVPTWATLIRIVVTLQGLEFIPGAAKQRTVAGFVTRYNGNPSAENGIMVQEAGALNQRDYASVAGEHAIPAADRGTTKTIEVMSSRTAGDGLWQADYQSIIAMDWEFVENPA